LARIYHPDDYDPSTEDEAMARDIDALNEEMNAARGTTVQLTKNQERHHGAW